ncbi:MAG: hypothetical protein IKL24_05065 [Clostridia bacterium]|nr:hypothetical protein [Clostridia bacterium]
MLVIGLDVGTTGTKAVVVDKSGNTLGSGYREYALKSEGGKVTQSAGDWWDAAVYAIRTATKNIDANRIVAMSLSTQAASMLCADRDGDAKSEVITWMDTRSSLEAEELSRAIGKEEIYKKSGWLPTPVLDAAKILWLKKNMPELFKATDYFISTLEYMNMKLCSRCVIDPTNAAMRQMFDIQTGKWDKAILDYIGIDESRLPEILPIGAKVGNLSATAAEELGLHTGVQVFNGAHDQYCASIGSGAIEAGDMLLATGTTWVVLGITDKLLYTESHISPGIHAVHGRYGALASLVSAGSALNWYRSIIDGDFKEMDRKAAERMESAKDLFLLPYVCGAGFPHNRPDLRGMMIGLDKGHDRYDIARALMEGVAFEAAAVLSQFKENGMDISTLMMTGGAARSDLWSEIVGYVTGCDIWRMKEPETCCMGAAMTAAVGAGIFKDYNECRSLMVKREKMNLDDPEKRAFYKEKATKYAALSEALRNIM